MTELVVGEKHQRQRDDSVLTVDVIQQTLEI